MTGSRHALHSCGHGGLRGFTLIELIVVMTLLATIMAISIPTLSNFFRGRRQTEEARRLLMLTRYARSQAVAEAVPVEIWFDPDKRFYGMRPQGQAMINTGGTTPVTDAHGAAIDPRLLVQFELANGVDLIVDTKQKNSQGDSSIVFLPDGTIDPDSLDGVAIREQSRNGEDTSVHDIGIVRSDIGVGYEIR